MWIKCEDNRRSAYLTCALEQSTYDPQMPPMHAIKVANRNCTATSCSGKLFQISDDRHEEISLKIELCGSLRIESIITECPINLIFVQQMACLSPSVSFVRPVNYVRRRHVSDSRMIAVLVGQACHDYSANRRTGQQLRKHITDGHLSVSYTHLRAHETLR